MILQNNRQDWRGMFAGLLILAGLIYAWLCFTCVLRQGHVSKDGYNESQRVFENRKHGSDVFCLGGLWFFGADRGFFRVGVRQRRPCCRVAFLVPDCRAGRYFPRGICSSVAGNRGAKQDTVCLYGA